MTTHATTDEVAKHGRSVVVGAKSTPIKLVNGSVGSVNGPLGPRFKNLGRKEICQGNEECILKRTRIGPNRPLHNKRFPHVGEGEEMNEDDVKRFVGEE